MKSNKKNSKTWVVSSLNLNGIRSAATKGLEEWLDLRKPDCMCVQELKAQIPDLERENLVTLSGMQGYFHPAEKKGYSGVGVYTREEPTEIILGFDGEEFDAEGRLIELRFDTLSKKTSVYSAYFPSGSSGEERQRAKYRFLDKLETYMLDRNAGREVVLCGDLNIAHTEKDIKNWRGNLKNSGFLPEERAWLSRFLEYGWVDVYRRLQPDTEEASYTWWSNRGAAYAKNVGWRLDYHLASAELAARARNVEIFKGIKFSDHAPITIEYDV